MNIKDRLQKLRQKLVEAELDGILVSQPEDRRYLSGFHGSAGLLLIGEKKAVLATDFRYTEQAKHQAPDYEVFQTNGPMAAWLPEQVGAIAARKLGFEAEHLTVAEHQQIREILAKMEPSVNLVPTRGIVEALRAGKEAEEIDLVTRAARIADAAYAHVDEVAHVGMTELELAWEIEKFMRENGSQPVPFSLIVASGPNAALPHAQPSSRAINEGEPVVIDIGAAVEGYSSDETRTICLGAPTDTFRKIYDIVLGAQLTAIATVKAGMTGEQADALARVVISEAGYGEAFGHSLGHGVGLATHEMPRLGMRSTDVLADNMVVTIEPGIYLPEWGGVRIEDIGVFEKGQLRVISKSRK